MRASVSFLFWLFMGVSCPPMFLIALLIFIVTFPFDRDGRVLHLFSCVWAQMYIHANPFWKVRIEGRERLPWRGAAVLVANHQSLGDILVLYGLYRPFKWVSKRSVFKVPFIGWNMQLNRYVSLVRGDKQSIVRMMAECRAWLKRGVPVLLFPEGTRSPDGELKPFKDGAFSLAIAENCPIYPIAISGTAKTLPKHGFVLRSSVKCRARVLEPVHPSAFNGDLQALKTHVQEIIAREVRALEQEA